MIKVRFHVYNDDYRPTDFPPPHPWWCTGAGDDYYTLVAYADSVDQLLEQWPDADSMDVFEGGVSEYSFSSRFPKPDWFKDE